MKTFLTIIILISCSSLLLSNAERILILSPVCSKSHKFSFLPIAESLADRGHRVTLVTPFPPINNRSVINLTELVIGNALDDNWFAMKTTNIFQATMDKLTNFYTLEEKGYENLINNQKFKKMIKSRQIDIVIVDAILSEFTLPIIDHLQVPFIFYSPASGVHWTMEAVNAPHEYATVPIGIGNNGSKMTFVERLMNMMMSQTFMLLRKVFLLNKLDNLIQKDFPNSRPIAEIERDSQLCLLNSHPATAWIRTLPPNVIPIVGLHIGPTKPLPQELLTLADQADEGFIVFTLGSVISVSSMPEHLVQKFVQLFARIPQQVFWKWEKSNGLIDNLSDNVKIISWLPQQDLLGHPNARLFISHGGLLGIQEAVYNGVPILGLPFGNDQLGNMAKVTEEGYGLKLNWDDLTKEDVLYETVLTLLHNPSFKGNATRFSKMMKDQILPGRDQAVYWVEHILRHGGKHLMSPSKNMPLYQIYMLDVWLFLITIISIVSYFSVKIFVYIIFKLRGGKIKKD